MSAGTDALEALGAIRAVGYFSGGNDEGFMDTMYLHYADGSEEQAHDAEGRTWTWTEVQGQRMMVSYDRLVHPRQKHINFLFHVLWQPVEERYGGFGGEGHVSGEVTLEVTGKWPVLSAGRSDW